MDLVISELTPGGPQGSISQLMIDVGSLESGVPQHMEITLDGLIWDLGVFNYGCGCV